MIMNIWWIGVINDRNGMITGRLISRFFFYYQLTPCPPSASRLMFSCNDVIYLVAVPREQPRRFIDMQSETSCFLYFRPT